MITKLGKKKTLISIAISLIIFMLIGIWGYCRVQQELCFVNMRSLISCIHVYMNDYDNRYPTPQEWCDLLKEEAMTPESDFKCPGAKKGPCTYALNENVSIYKFGIAPDDLVFMFEAKPGWNQVGGSELLTTEYHEGRGCHIMYANLTVEFVKEENLESLRWN